MKRKNKLKEIKEEQIFIENDLTWEERKIQERINKWAKEKKSIEEDIKIGKVRIKDIWKFWSDIEKEEEQRVGERKDNRDEKEEENERNRNFV